MADGIVPLRVGELAELAHFVNVCWRAAYAGLLDADFLVRLTDDDRAARIQRDLDGDARCWVTRDGAGLTGMAVARPSDMEGLTGGGEIRTLYVRADAMGAGLGYAPYRHACRYLAELGFSSVVLDVFVGNESGMRFYRRQGLRVVRHTGLDMDGRRYPLDILRGPLIDGA
jgi:ribosomal protein S18 acetylase RimI-like enzyme